MAYALTDRLRLAGGAVSLDDLDPGSTPGFDGGKRDAAKALRDMGEELADLQERMFANAYTGGSRRVLVVLQGMDTSGKGGVIDHALGLLRPSGLRVTSFKKPTEEELSHDFLWRIEQAAARCRGWSASSTGRTTRTSSWRGCSSWRTPRRSSAATAPSTSSRRSWSTTARWC